MLHAREITMNVLGAEKKPPIETGVAVQKRLFRNWLVFGLFTDVVHHRKFPPPFFFFSNSVEQVLAILY